MNLRRSIWTVVAAIMVIGASTAIVPDARAGIALYYYSPTLASNQANPGTCGGTNTAPSYKVRYTVTFGGCTVFDKFTKWRYPWGSSTQCAGANEIQYPLGGTIGSTALFMRDCPVNDPTTQNGSDRVLANGSVDLAGVPSSYCICNGDVIAGTSGLGTSAVGDTMKSHVGSQTNPMKGNVARSGNLITLSNITGELYVKPGNVRTGAIRTTFIVAVYPDTATAHNANPLARGQALWWGRVNLNKDVRGKAFGMDGDFGGSDFTSPTDSTAVPGAFTKSVDITGHPDAVVVFYSDPKVGMGAVPGTSPVGILALSAAMAGAGLWVVTRRRRLA